MTTFQNPILDEYLVGAIMESLENSYKPFVQFIKSNHEDICYTDLYGLFFSEEQQLHIESFTINDSIPLTAYLVHKNHHHSSHSHGRGNNHKGRGGRQRRHSYVTYDNRTSQPSNYTICFFSIFF